MDEKEQKKAMKLIYELMRRREIIVKRFKHWPTIFCGLLAFSFTYIIMHFTGIGGVFPSMIIAVVFFDVFYFKYAYELAIKKYKLGKKITSLKSDKKSL